MWVAFSVILTTQSLFRIAGCSPRAGYRPSATTEVSYQWRPADDEGAGTTAAGLKEGLPTVVIPFFGDQT